MIRVQCDRTGGICLTPMECGTRGCTLTLNSPQETGNHRCVKNGFTCIDPSRCSLEGCKIEMPQEIEHPKGKREEVQTCVLVSHVGIIVRKFKAVVSKLGQHVEFNGKCYERKHVNGGGEPAFYEIQPWVIHDQDISH